MIQALIGKERTVVDGLHTPRIDTFESQLAIQTQQRPLGVERQSFQQERTPLFGCGSPRHRRSGRCLRGQPVVNVDEIKFELNDFRAHLALLTKAVLLGQVSCFEEDEIDVSHRCWLLIAVQLVPDRRADGTGADPLILEHQPVRSVKGMHQPGR